jgi:hypothetical protein
VHRERVGEDPRAQFASVVKRIDPLFKRGELEPFWAALRELISLAPDHDDLWRKKSHYLVSVALRSIKRRDLASARTFLDFADLRIPDGPLTPYFRREREEMRRRLQEAERSDSTGA